MPPIELRPPLLHQLHPPSISLRLPHIFSANPEDPTNSPRNAIVTAIAVFSFFGACFVIVAVWVHCLPPTDTLDHRRPSNFRRPRRRSSGSSHRRSSGTNASSPGLTGFQEWCRRRNSRLTLKPSSPSRLPATKTTLPPSSSSQKPWCQPIDTKFWRDQSRGKVFTFPPLLDGTDHDVYDTFGPGSVRGENGNDGDDDCCTPRHSPPTMKSAENNHGEWWFGRGGGGEDRGEDEVENRRRDRGRYRKSIHAMTNTTEVSPPARRPVRYTRSKSMPADWMSPSGSPSRRDSIKGSWGASTKHGWSKVQKSGCGEEGLAAERMRVKSLGRRSADGGDRGSNTNRARDGLRSLTTRPDTRFIGDQCGLDVVFEETGSI